MKNLSVLCVGGRGQPMLAGGREGGGVSMEPPLSSLDSTFNTVRRSLSFIEIRY
jgi:hypothetical protein